MVGANGRSPLQMAAEKEICVSPDLYKHISSIDGLLQSI